MVGRKVFVVFLVCVATAVAAAAQANFTTLISFDGTDGSAPYSALVQGTDGSFYGTTESGGANRNCLSNYDTIACGTVFKITPRGMLTTLYNFCSQLECTDGALPFAGLMLGRDGDFYGMTEHGGSNNGCHTGLDTPGCGTIFKITPEGVLTTLYNFCSRLKCRDGSWPRTALVQGTNGNLYGMTEAGGAGWGTFFEFTSRGALNTLFSPCAQERNCDPDGEGHTAPLIQHSDGNFYGTSNYAGAGGWGTVFRITPTGDYTVLFTFCMTRGCPEGLIPTSGLIEGADGNFYGVATNGGPTTETGTCIEQYTSVGCGTIFKITPGGMLTVLYSFCSRPECADGAYPTSLVLGSDRNFYGTTTGLGAHNFGTIFKLTPDGTLTTLHSFCSATPCTDGYEAYAGLLQATSGGFRGSTLPSSTQEFNAGDGTIYHLSAGLGPFVKTQPAFGSVGTKVVIFGGNLAGATSVSFNGTATTFRVISHSKIETTVPVGATSGNVEVTTPVSGTLNSNANFVVTP